MPTDLRVDSNNYMNQLQPNPIRSPLRAETHRRWNPSELMEWAKFGYVGAKYNLCRSGVPSITNLNELPGAPINPELWGANFAGHEELKSVLAEMYGCEPQNVLLAQGASQCTYLIGGTLLAEGGTAIVETPVYDPILRGVESWATQIKRLPRRKENGYLPDPDELRTLLTTETKLVVLTNLHNPSQVQISSSLMCELVDTARSFGARVLVDEVYLPMIERNHMRHGFGLGAISINSLDKSWGLDALRVGWAVADTETVHTAYRLNNLMGVNQPYITEDIGYRVLSDPAKVKFLTVRAELYAAQRSLISNFFSRTPRVSCVRPAGGISTLVQLPDGMDDLSFQQTLLAERETIVFPGSLFEAPGTIRVSVGGPKDEIEEGLNRLHEAIG